MRRVLNPYQDISNGWDIVRSERGLTLTEITVVGVLAVIVMLSLTGFYYNAQRMWLESSTKAMTQRDAALLMDVIGRSVHRSAKAVIDPSDSTRHQLSLYASKNDLMPREEYAVDASDGRVHRFENNLDLGPVVDSQALRLRFKTLDTNLVILDLAELTSQNGDLVRIATRYQLLGR